MTAKEGEVGKQQAAAAYWDERHFDPTFLRGEWSFHPLAKARLHRTLGGVESREQWFHDRFLSGRTGLRALGIGVGRAASELTLLTKGAIDRYELFDVSPVALAEGKREAERLGVADKAIFRNEDIQATELPDNSYDVITFIASLHHMTELEAVLRKCARALAPGGVIWAAEYIGPDYFQYPPEHADIARRLYRMMHPNLRRSGEPDLKFPSQEDVIANDPTESPQSSRIEEVFRRVWPDAEVIGTYGSLAFMVMWTLDHDALYDSASGREAFGTLLDLDTALIDACALPHYFAYLVGRNPVASPRSLVGRIAGPFARIFGG